MKITMELIDHEGFWHIKQGKSRRLVLEWLKLLAPGTEVKWQGPDKVFVSQQYVKVAGK